MASQGDQPYINPDPYQDVQAGGGGGQQGEGAAGGAESASFSLKKVGDVFKKGLKVKKKKDKKHKTQGVELPEGRSEDLAAMRSMFDSPEMGRTSDADPYRDAQNGMDPEGMQAQQPPLEEDDEGYEQEAPGGPTGSGGKKFTLGKLKLPKMKGLKRTGSKRSREAEEEYDRDPEDLSEVPRDIQEPDPTSPPSLYQLTSPTDVPLMRGMTSPVSPAAPANYRASGFHDGSLYPVNTIEPSSPEPHLYAEPTTTWGKMTSDFKNFFVGTASPIVVATPGEDLAPLHPPPKRSACRCTVAIIIFFILFIITGILLLIFGTIRDNYIAWMLGPNFLGLGCFVLIGYIFFMCFWKDDPLPYAKPVMAKIDASAVGGVKDPYGLQEASTYKASGFRYPGSKCHAVMHYSLARLTEK